MYTVNIWAILVAAVVGFGIGALWYSPILFGKEWARLSKMTEADINAAKAKGMWKNYLIHLIGLIISFGVLAFLISATGAATASDGAILGLITWLGFVIPMNIADALWRRTQIKLVILDTLNVLIGLVIGGAIICAWM